MDHTVDIDPSKSTVNWLMGYLNCQVIHTSSRTCRIPTAGVSRTIVSLCSGTQLQGALVLRRVEATFSNLNQVGQHYYVNGKAHAD